MSLQQPVYILSAAAVSPQLSFEQMMLDPVNYTGDKLTCIEPDYTKYVDAKLIRRMSRIIKMGVAAASEALQQANVQCPDAIITGTAYGCLTDTDQFLTRMVEFKETLLSPTAFIQSTHNTVAAQIALMLQCHSYNNTYVHRGSSFEAALMDAISLLQENEEQQILLGAADEITEKSHAILKRFGLYKPEGESLSLPHSNTKGTMAGDGAAFFVVSNKPQHDVQAEIVAFKNYYKPSGDKAVLIQSFLKEHEISAADIDLIILGHNGDTKENSYYEEIKSKVFASNRSTPYKQFCGEYPTSSAFALWMGTQIVAAGEFGQNPVKSVLIYNDYLLSYPSIYILRAC